MPALWRAIAQAFRATVRLAGAGAGFAAAGGAFCGAGFGLATGFAAAATFFGFAFSAAGLGFSGGFSKTGSGAVTACFGACSAVATAGFGPVAGFFGALRAVSLGKPLGRQVLGFGIDGFGRRAIQGDALIMRKDGPAVECCQFPDAQDAERVGQRPPHRGGDFAAGARRQRANVVKLEWKRQRPFLPQHQKLLGGVFDAAIALKLRNRFAGLDFCQAFGR